MQRTFLVATAVAAAVAGSVWGLGSAQSGTWGKNYIPNLPVVTQDGKHVNFYDDVIKDKLVVISFIYTSCPDVCPLSTARLAQVEDKLGKAMGKSIFFVTMTVDPEVDTPEKLKAYSKAYDTGPGWTFITGKPEDVRAINYKFGDRSEKNLSDHRNEIVLGNDATGEWQRESIFGDLDHLVLTIRAMDPSYRNQVHSPDRPDTAGVRSTGDGLIALHAGTGEVLFRKICAPCHTVGVGDRVGPDLRGVTARRDHEWLMNFIKSPAKMRAQKDPTALALAEKFSGVHMPNLGLADNDVADLITFVHDKTAKLEADQGPPMDHSKHGHSMSDHSVPMPDHAAHDHPAAKPPVPDHAAHDHPMPNHSMHDHSMPDHSAQDQSGPPHQHQ